MFIYEIEYISRNRLTTNMYSIFRHNFFCCFFFTTTTKNLILNIFDRKEIRQEINEKKKTDELEN